MESGFRSTAAGDVNHQPQGPFDCYFLQAVILVVVVVACRYRHYDSCHSVCLLFSLLVAAAALAACDAH